MGDADMSDRESNCIRAMLNFARWGVITWDALRAKMRADGWSDDESKAALAEINPMVLPPSSKEKKDGGS